MSGHFYESPRLLAEYLLLHYGDAEAVLGGLPGPAEAVNFPVRVVRELLAPCSAESRALDIGCAVGRASFELARHCREVVGIDYSHGFIRAANVLRETGSTTFEKIVEGSITEPCIARVPSEIDRGRTTFGQGDAMSLPDALGTFDVVLAANLLCRLSAPLRFLSRLPSLVRPGGQLLLTTPLTWLEEFTPESQWIGGTPQTGRSFDALRDLLSPHFALEHKADIPFLFREHARKFQYVVSLGTRWRRR